jgi:hypothetical protein
VEVPWKEVDEMTEEIGEAKKVSTNLGFVAKVLGTAIFVVYSGAMIYARLNYLELEIERLRHDVERNSFFRDNWPRGTIGSLPDDAEQNMRLNFLEKKQETHSTLLDDLRFNKNGP